LKRPLRLVLDTNVVVAGLLWNGPPRRLIVAAAAADIELFSSAALLAELAQTLGYAKFRSRLAAYNTEAAEMTAQFAALARVVTPGNVPRVVLNDVDDDQVIAAGVAARAHWIVTGDRKHLLPLGSHAGIAIITPAEALVRLATTGGA
jgi:uncharacterized protein